MIVTTESTTALPAPPPCTSWCEIAHAGEGGWDQVQRVPSGIYATKLCGHSAVTVELDEDVSIEIAVDRFASFSDADGPEMEVHRPRCRIDGAWATIAQTRMLTDALSAAAIVAEQS